MDATSSSRAADRAARRARRAAVWVPIGQRALAVGAATLAAMWIWTALTSNHSTPWYNDWLVILVLYALFFMLAMPRIVFHRGSQSGAHEPKHVRSRSSRTTVKGRAGCCRWRSG